MASILNAVSLLLIGGATGALAFGGDRGGRIVDAIGVPAWSAISRAATVEAVASPAVAVPSLPPPATQQVELAPRLPPALDTGDAPASVPAVAKLRIAQATTGQTTDAARPYPAVRPVPGSSAQAADTSAASARNRLAESIQKELQRVGCYSGSIDGDWGADTRRAMKAFNERVNASLPVDQPDYILLTLLQGHAAKACGAACPAGQGLSDGGKCLPRSVIAEERRRIVAERDATAGARHEPSAAASTARAAVAREETPAPTTPAADAARQRIAAAEAARRQRDADAKARVEAKRLARIAEAQKAREQAEAHRAELAALATRTAREEQKAADAAAAARGSLVTGSVTTAAATTAAATAAPPLPVRPSATFQARPAAVSDVPKVAEERRAASADAAKKPHHRHAKPREAREPRYAARYMPPPTYRVGRLELGPPRFAPVRVFGFAARAEPVRKSNPQRIFLELQHRMP